MVTQHVELFKLPGLHAYHWLNSIMTCHMCTISSIYTLVLYMILTSYYYIDFINSWSITQRDLFLHYLFDHFVRHANEIWKEWRALTRYQILLASCTGCLDSDQWCDQNHLVSFCNAFVWLSRRKWKSAILWRKPIKVDMLNHYTL